MSKSEMWKRLDMKLWKRLDLQTFAEDHPGETPEETKELDQREEEAAEKAEEEREKEVEAGAKEAEASAENPSSTKSEKDEVSHLREMFQMLIQKVDLIHDLARETREDSQATNAEMRETINLHQSVIGDLDHQVNQLGTATSALIKLHQAQQKAKN